MIKQYAVLGLGKFGESVALALENLHCDVIVVDNRREKIHEIAERVSYAIHANIADPEVIKSLGARNLDGVIVGVSEHLEDSILATITSKEAGVPYVLAKAQSSLHADILKKVGADAVIFPEREMGDRIAKTLVDADFTDWINLSPDYSMMEVGIPEEWVGHTIKDLKLRQTYGVNVVGLLKKDRVIINVDPERPLEPGIILILIGDNEALNTIMQK